MNIDEIVSKNAHSTLVAISDTISNKMNILISKSSIENGLEQLRYHYMPPKLSEQQKINPIISEKTILNLCFQHKIDLQNIVFSDESRFILGDDKQWFWRHYGDNNPSAVATLQKFPPTVMIYGAIGVDYKSKLVIVETSINSEVYQDNISKSEMIEYMDSVRGRRNWVFMQDGAKSHTSCSTQNWLATKCRYIQKWPINSPDHNHIETMWFC